MKKYLFLLICLLLPVSTQAAALDLYFSENNGQLQLTALPQLDTSSELSSMEFKQRSASSQGVYRLYISDMYDKPLIDYRFNAPGETFTLEVPYYETVKHLSVSTVREGQLLIDQDLSSLATCFPNNICEYEKGETEVSCLVDCSRNEPRYSSATLKQLKAAGGLIKDSQGVRLVELRGNPTNPLTWPLIIGALLLASALIFWYVKKKSSRR